MKQITENKMNPREAELNEYLSLSDAEAAELTAEVDFDKVWKITAARIAGKESGQRTEGTSPADAVLSTTAGRRFSRRARCLMAAAALVLCFGGAVFAVQKGYFETFFGIEPLSEGQILRVNESQSSDGVRMTLAEVIPGETDGVITVAFERVDGKPFPENVHLARFDVLLDGKGVGTTSGRRLSDDRRQLLYCIEIDGGETPITGKTLTLEAGTIYKVTARETRCDSINLKELYDPCPVNLSAEEMAELAGEDDPDMLNIHSGDAICQELAQQMKAQTAFIETDERQNTVSSGVHVAGVGFLKGKLCIGVQIPGAKQEQNLSQSHSKEQEALRISACASVLDRRTDKEFLWSRMNQSTADDGRTITFTTFEQEDFTEEDLPFLAPVITCEHKELISQGQWALSYTFSESLTKNLKTDIVRSLTEGSIQITDAKISVMGVSLYGKWLDYVEGVSPYGGAAPYQPKVKAILKDGSEIELTWNQTRISDSTGGFFSYKYILENPDGEDQERRFFDKDLIARIAEISIDETVIPVL